MSENEARDPLAGPERISHTQWTQMLSSSPAEARRYHDEGRIDFPEHVRQGLVARRSDEVPNPLGFKGAEELSRKAELDRRATMTLEERKALLEEQTAARQEVVTGEALSEQRQFEAEKREATAELGRISHTEWSELSEKDPEQAKRYHRYDLVDLPDYLARHFAAKQKGH